ncbi:MAG: hypothetical protein ACI86M_003887, partial [Saprospiraceae bacterium]
QLKTPVLFNQICTSHIRRELKYFIEKCKSKWSREFLNLIYTACIQLINATASWKSINVNYGYHQYKVVVFLL